MTFQELKDHCEDLCCTFDHLEDKSYYVNNLINFNVCIVEDLASYSNVTLVHYFYELGISAPSYLKEHLSRYRQLRDDIRDKHNVPTSED